MQSIYLLRNNETIAGEQDLVRDHDLIRRTHTQGMLQTDRRAGDEWESSIYVFEGQVAGDRNSAASALNMTLRPGEAIVWRWGHLNPIKYHGPRPPRFPDTVCNGLWEYRPDFKQPSSRAAPPPPCRSGKRTAFSWRRKEKQASSSGRFRAHTSLSVEGSKSTVPARGSSSPGMASPGTRSIGNLDGFFPSEGPARYRYYLKCELSGDAQLRRLGITNDLQMAPLTLPGMGVGTNAFTYTDESASGRRMRITQQWVERSASRPPVAPARSGLSSRGRSDRRDRDQFPVAAGHRSRRRCDQRLPLRTLRTRRHEVAPLDELRQAHLSDSRRRPGAYTLPGPGLLNPGTKYFWHVRARDDKGVWGPWSPTWSFTPRGPAPPQDVYLEFDRERGRGVLRWAPNPVGHKPMAYRVYASDEKGFSVSDRPYTVTVGESKEMSSVFPANFVVETSAAELEVVGRHVKLEGANKAFYRVAAVDAAGNRSGPSDYAASPRPVIVTAPVTQARKGVAYHYPVEAIRSLGDLRTRVVNGKETMKFWDVERFRFDIERGPRWLTIDQATGSCRGRPIDRARRRSLSA